MAALPYMQLYVADYLADTMHLNAEEHGAYLMLIMNYWQTGKPLLDNDHRLSNIAKVPTERWLAVKSILVEYFILTDGFLVHPRIQADLQYVEDKQRKSVEAGKASALAREKKKEAKINARSNGRSNKRSTDVDETLQPKPNHIDPDPDPDIDPENNVATKVATHLAGKIIEHNPSVKLKPESWVVDIGRAIRIDGRTGQQLIELIDYIYRDNHFWIPNIMSGRKLREKYDTIFMQMRTKDEKTTNNPSISRAAANQIAALERIKAM